MFLVIAATARRRCAGLIRPSTGDFPMKSPLMAVFFAATLAFAHSAGAQIDGSYGYWGVGLSSVDASQSTDLYGSDDDEATGSKVFSGFIVRDSDDEPGIGLELGLVSHGETSYGFVSSASADITMHSYYLAAVGTIPMGKRVELFGKLGSHYWNFEATGRGSLFGKDDDKGFDWFYGVGVDIGAEDKTGPILRLEYEVFSAEPSVTVSTLSGTTEVKGDYEASHVSASLIWKFK